MLSPWLMRVYLGTAIALPSSALVGLTLPVEAATGADKAPVKETLSAAVPSSGGHVTRDASPELSRPSVDQPTADNVSEAPAPTLATAAPRPEAAVTAQLALAPQFSPLEKPAQTKSEPLPRGVAFAPEALTGSADAMAQPEILLSQAEAESPVEETDDSAPPEAEESVDSLDDADDEADEFSPLPDSDAEEAIEEPLPETTNEDETDAPEDTEESVDPDATAPLPRTGSPAPGEGAWDDIPALDPSPNPLLIQTQPEEVEIIGTQPVTLEEAIELSYRNNPDLRTALLELEQSQAALREAQAANFPTLSVNGTLQGQNTTDSSTEVVTTPGGGLAFETSSTEELGASASAQVDLVYNLYSSGQRGATIRAAEEQVRLSELEVERRREDLRLNTANEYYDLQASIESIRISEAFLEEAERNLRDTSLREEVGVGTRFDVLRAEVQVANARQDVVNAERSRQVAQSTLARRLNVPPALTITTVPVDIAGNWPLGLEESIVLAYQNRAELEQQLVQSDISEELRVAELAALGPQVDLFANYTISDTLTQSDSFNDNYSFGARVSWTLFEGGAAQARARQRELDSEISERNFEESRNTIRLSVESAYYNLEANLTNIDTARLSVEQAQEALELAILRFDAGVGTQLDILNAQSELTDAEVNLVEAIVGYNRSLAEIKRAVSNLPEPY
ncbi:MAG: TolC family protein [Leptolyngbyaceae cyanobacterium]